MPIDLTILISGIIGLITGALGSLVAPWVNWGIEKRKMRIEARRNLIEEARKELQKKPTSEEFRDTAIYSQIRQFLSEDVRNEIERDDYIGIELGGRGAGVNNFVPKVLDQLQVLESKWKLL